LLKRLTTKCRCDTLDQCGERILRTMNSHAPTTPLASGGRREECVRALREWHK
jgi:hypothetical protein